ncbi:MAG: tRNA guanosine(34) transglycosylase Tgt [Proteobacteria bacterium]|nr:tRNA guanosine(34) transglycosylase Tgt [Pseudomonadota bacterium]
MFELISTQDKARYGRLMVKRGVLETPLFMPVATAGAIKSLTQRDLEALGANIILANTYHLSLREVPQLIHQAGSLHQFIGWDKPILTDSGGFQIFSLNNLTKLSQEGASFRSHIDGQMLHFTPENVTAYQEQLGSDIHMVLDECLEDGVSKQRTKESVDLSLSWARRSRKARHNLELLQFGIVQGGMYPELRKQSALELTAMDFEGYGIGGLSVGESKDKMTDMIEIATEHLPQNKPRYLMGVGTPADIIRAVALGVDMFDCVMPTRNARNGSVFTSFGRLNIRNQEHKFSGEPLDSNCDCYTCRNHTRSYLRHLFLAKEMTAKTLLTIHNLHFYLKLMTDIRTAIQEQTFPSLASHILRVFNR